MLTRLLGALPVSGVNKFYEKGQRKSIMLSVDKDTNIFDDKKEAVVTTPLLEKRLSTTEKVTTSDEVQKCTDNITPNEEVNKCTENRRVRKRQWSQLVGRIQISLRVILKYLQDGLILIMSLKNLHLNQTSMKTL